MTDPESPDSKATHPAPRISSRPLGGASATRYLVLAAGCFATRQASADSERPPPPAEASLASPSEDASQWTFSPEHARDLVAPPLEILPASIQTAPVPTVMGPLPHAAPREWSARQTWGLIVAGVGAAGVGMGGYFGVRAMIDSDEARARCAPPTLCTDPEAAKMADRAKTEAAISTIALGGGLAGVALGGYLFFAAPPTKEKPQRAYRVTPRMASNSWSVTVAGPW